MTRLAGAELDAVGRSCLTRPELFGDTDAALAEAIYIGFFFNLINRVADALGFAHRSDGDRLRGAGVLLRGGYRLPRFLLG
jgi:hypothetical protein